MRYNENRPRPAGLLVREEGERSGRRRDESERDWWPTSLTWVEDSGTHSPCVTKPREVSTVVLRAGYSTGRTTLPDKPKISYLFILDEE